MKSTSTTSAQPPCPPDSIPSRFARVVREHADRDAVSGPGAKWSYRELHDRASAVAARIREQGGKTESPVALMMEHDAPLVAAVLGVLKAGAIYACLDPAQPRRQLSAVLENSQCTLVVADEANAALARDLAPRSVPVVVLDGDGPWQTTASEEPEVCPTAGAWLTYTSGSTGTPKGVWRCHAGVVHHSDVYAGLIQVRPDDRFSLLTSLSLAASATPLFTALLHGACVCLFDVRSQGTSPLAKWIARENVTLYQSVPSVFRRLTRGLTTDGKLRPLRVVRLGGEAVLREDVESFQRHAPDACRLVHALSSTETGLVSAWVIDTHSPLPEGRVPVGRVVDGVGVRLVDDEEEPVPPGTPGRMVVRSAFLAKGYWGRPADTQSVFRRDPSDPNGGQFFSGDLGRFTADGVLEHLGRIDAEVKVLGRRIDLTDIETTLRGMDGIEEAVVTVEPRQTGDTGLVGWVVNERGAAVSTQTCRRFLADRLPAHLIPGQIIRLSELPTTATGKPDRQALSREHKHRNHTSESRPMPRDDIEKHVASLWQSVLGIQGVGREDNLFDLGADSLHVVEIVTRVSEAFGIEVSTSILMEHPTVERLSAFVAGKVVKHSSSPLIDLQNSGTGSPLFLVPGGYGHVTLFGPLSRHFTDRPVYAFQAPGLEGECWPLTRIPAIAQRYLQEILPAQPVGRIHLAGVCVGGTVVFEMARQLAAQGREVGMVALIHTYHPRAAAGGVPVWDPFRRTVRDTCRILRWRLIRAAGGDRSPGWLPAYRRFISHMYGRARRLYRPGWYVGKIGLVFAGGERPPQGENDPQRRMGRHAAECVEAVLPYQLQELFKPPHVEELAGTLRRWMEDA